MTAISIVPQPFQPGPRLIDGSDLNNAVGADIVSSTNGITAFATGGVTNAVLLTTVINRVTTVANANDSVRLPPALAGASCYVDNDGSNTLAVYPSGTDTVEDSTSAISLIAGEDTTFVCPVAGKWYETGVSGILTGTFDGVVGGTTPNNGTFTNLKANTKFTYLATSGRIGTFVNNGATLVTTANTLVTANSFFLISMNTPGGTVAGAPPNVSAFTAATNFVTKGTASDSSTYNYMIIETA